MVSVTALFGLDKLAPEKARALSIVYATSIALMMGVNFIQPALPALSQPFQVSDAQLSLVMTVFTAPAIVLSPIFGVIADLYRSEEHTSELQSLRHLVCRLLLEKKKKMILHSGPSKAKDDCTPSRIRAGATEQTSNTVHEECGKPSVNSVGGRSVCRDARRACIY